MEYKVGDKVIVRQYDEADSHWGISREDWDATLGGCVCTISRIDTESCRSNPIYVKCKVPNDHPTPFGFWHWWIALSDITLFDPAHEEQYDLKR